MSYTMKCKEISCVTEEEPFPFRTVAGTNVTFCLSFPVLSAALLSIQEEKASGPLQPPVAT